MSVPSAMPQRFRQTSFGASPVHRIRTFSKHPLEGSPTHRRCRVLQDPTHRFAVIVGQILTACLCTCLRCHFILPIVAEDRRRQTSRASAKDTRPRLGLCGAQCFTATGLRERSFIFVDLIKARDIDDLRGLSMREG